MAKKLVEEIDPMRAMLTDALIARGIGSGWIERMMGEEPTPRHRDHADWRIIQGTLDAMRLAYQAGRNSVPTAA